MSAGEKKESEVEMLRRKLNDMSIEVKQEAIRGIIDYMTAGKDVSMLFMDVLKNMETPSIQLKKLIYLYVMSYAKVHPDLAILGVNTFRKDAIDKNNPFLRGLAVRTMGCIRIKYITVYLCDPLKKALKDYDPYVRKTGALCVPKLYEIAPQLIEYEGFLKLLYNLLSDGNAAVVSNSVASLSICSEIKGKPLLNLTSGFVQKLLTAMNDCNEWGAVYILDALSGYIPKDPAEAEGIMERVASRLSHTNSAVALSSIRLMLRYMDYLGSGESVRAYTQKVSPPLVTLISREAYISYVALKTLNIVLQRRSLLLPKELKVFFVNYHDPLYLKLYKLYVLGKIATNENILIILHEIKEYLHEVDVYFVRRTVKTMAKCAIKLDKSADKCVQCLADALKGKVSFIVQEVVISFRDIFRKYPKTYDGLLADICGQFEGLDDPEAKAAIIWIIGEYIDIVGNADDIMASFIENFKDYPDVVQQQILITSMKLYLHRPEEGQELLKDLFKHLTRECENPDLRDRGFIYWRMLSTNPQLAKQIVLSQRPLISEQSYSLDTEFLDKLIEHLGTLASVYTKLPYDFVKRLKDNANAQYEIIVEDPEALLAQKDDKPEPIVYEKPTTFNRAELVANTPSELLYVEPRLQAKEIVQTDLLDLSSPVTNSFGQVQEKSYPLDYSSTRFMQQPSSMQSFVMQSSIMPSQFMQSTITYSKLLYPPPSHRNIVVPFVDVLQENQPSREGRFVGLWIKGAFQREGSKVFLQLVLRNGTNSHLHDFAFKISSNAFSFGYAPLAIPSLSLNPGETDEVKLYLSNDNVHAYLYVFPYFIDCALKVVDDIFIFKVPCSLSVAMVSNAVITIEDYKQIVSSEQTQKKEEVISNRLSLNDFIIRLKDNNLVELMRQDKGQKELLLIACELIGGLKLVAEIIFDKETNVPNMRLIGPNVTYIAYFYHALSMIVNM